jgi:glycerol-3-phosphate O-acyltransferase/dihydroxyacetone phosphate acyltransferase
MPFKQRIATSLQSIVSSARTLALNEKPSAGPAPMNEIFPRTQASIDGDDCAHDCGTCTIRYPGNFKIETDDLLYGHVTEWSTHVLVATGKTDWVRDVADEKGSVMQAIEKADSPTNGVSDQPELPQILLTELSRN